MVIWKECEHNPDDAHATNDTMIMRALRECGLLKYFRVSSMRAHVCLLDHLVHMWDPEKQNFQVGTHILIIDVEDIYFLTRLSQRGSLILLTSPRGEDMSIDDLIYEYYVAETRS